MTTQLPDPKLIWYSEDACCRVVQEWHKDPGLDTPIFDTLTVEVVVGYASLGEPVWEATENDSLSNECLRELLVRLGALEPDSTRPSRTGPGAAR